MTPAEIHTNAFSKLAPMRKKPFYLEPPYFFTGNLDCPIFSPRNITFNTLSIEPKTF